MKSVFTLFLSLFLVSGILAQSKVDPRLVDALGDETLNYLAKNNPFLIEYQTAQLDHLWEIREFPEGKLGSMQEINLKKSEIKDPNILILIKKYNLKRAKDHNSFYRIGRSNKVLVLISEDRFAEKFNSLTGRTR